MSVDKKQSDQQRFEQITWPAFKGIVDAVEGFFKMITDDQLLELNGLLDRLERTHFQLNWKGRIAEEIEHRGIDEGKKLH